MATQTRRRYGWIRDHYDQNDKRYSIPAHLQAALPPSVDLRPECTPVRDQGELGSCSAEATVAALEFVAKKQNEPDLPLSVLFQYYTERTAQGTINSDSGSSIKVGFQVAQAQGICPESLWQYDISQFKVQPPEDRYQAAMLHKDLSDQVVAHDLSALRACLADGYPFAFGFSVYQSFESQQVASTGFVPIPRHGEQFLGGHAVLCCGYHDGEQVFMVKNSWGTSWGQAGYFLMPYAYMVSRLASDFRTIKTVQ